MPVLLGSLAVFEAGAAEEETDPFRGIFGVEPIPLTTLSTVDESEEGGLRRMTFRDESSASHRLVVTSGPRGISAEVTSENGTLFPATRVLDESLMWCCEAKSGDLNLDGVTDYIVTANYGGAGLAAAGEAMVYLLSDGDGYSPRSIEHNLMLLPEGDEHVLVSGRPAILWTGYYPANVSGFECDLLVYRLLPVDGPHIMDGGQVHASFPKVIPFGVCSASENNCADAEVSALRRVRPVITHVARKSEQPDTFSGKSPSHE